LRFLGHHVRVRAHPDHGRLMSAIVIPKDRGQRLRERIKDLFRRRTVQATLESRLKRLNPMLRGWCVFYKHAWGAKKVFDRLDHYVWWTIFRWLRKKHPTKSVKWVIAQYGRRKPNGRAIRWQDGSTQVFQMASMPVHRFMLGWQKPPSFAIADG